MQSNTRQTEETFQEFIRSFAYGTRNDLNFKFLAKLSEEESATFLQELLWKLGDACDDGGIDRMIEHIHAGQVQAYAGRGQWTYAEGPFTHLKQPCSESRLALLTSSGHFVAGDDPRPFGVENMTQEDAVRRIGDFIKAEPRLATIPFDTPSEALRVRHGGYDIRAAQADPNVALPLHRLQELQQEGRIGSLAPNVYSFVGACAQTRLLKETGPRWVEILTSQQIDGLLLVPV